MWIWNWWWPTTKERKQEQRQSPTHTATSFPAATPAYCFFFFLHYTLACCIPFRFIYRKKLRLDSLKKNVRRKRNGKNSLAFGIFVLSVDFYVSVAVALPRFVLFAHFNRFVLCANSNSSAQFVRTLTHSLSQQRSHITVSHSFFLPCFGRSAQLCYHSRLLYCAPLRCCSLSLSLSLWHGRAFLSACAFFAFSPSCGNE